MKIRGLQYKDTAIVIKSNGREHTIAVCSKANVTRFATGSYRKATLVAMKWVDELERGK